MKKIYLAVLSILCLSIFSSAQTTLVGWNFDVDGINSSGIPANVGTTITSIGTDPAFFQDVACTGGEAIADNWSSGDRWESTSFSTLGYFNVTYSFEHSSYTNGPDIFSFLYSLDGVSWNTVQSNYAVPYNAGCAPWASFTDISFGGAIDNQATVYLAWQCVSPGTTIAGNRMDEVYIKGQQCIDPDVPTVTATQPSICVGNSATLNITGNLNDATQWHIYTGSCGGTQIGTTATSSFVVSPSTTTTYYIRGEGGCVTPGSCGSVTVTVNPIDDASFSYGAAAYCVNAADPTPTITGLPGGTFTSTPGLSINAATGQIDVSASTPSTYTVTYTTAGTCPNASNVSVTVNALDDASFSYGAAAYCVNDADPTPTITGLAGGTFTSTPGLSINAATGQIDVSASTPGTYTVTYTTAGTCPNSSNISVTVNALDNASFSYGASAYCVNNVDPTPTVTGLAGGTFTSTPGLSINAATGQIDVSASTPGTYTVTYTTSGFCPNSSNVSVTINALDDAGFFYGNSAYCTNDADPAVAITGLPGGTFTSTAGLSLNATTGDVDLSASTPGTYDVTYTTTGTCPNSSVFTLTINALDDASFTYDAATYCQDVNPLPTISGVPGGTFSTSPGLVIDVNTGEIDVAASTLGTYTVTYSTAGSAASTCPNSSTFDVTITTPDDAGFFYGNTDYCVNDADPTPAITGLPGGTFTTTPGLVLDFNTGVIDLSASTPGTYDVTYTTAGTCTNSSVFTLTVNALDDASFAYDAAVYCQNLANPLPTISGVPGGTFTTTPGLVIDVNTGEIDLAGSTVGTYTVTYTTGGAASTCPSSSTFDVTINTAEDAGFFYGNTDYCVNDVDPVPAITGLPGGTFTTSPGLVIDFNTGVIDLSASTPGTYDVTYTTSGTCPNSSVFTLTVNPLDDASFSYDAASYCLNATNPLPTVTGVTGGTYTTTPGLVIDFNTGEIDLASSTPGTYDVTYTTSGTCPNSSTVSVTIGDVVAPVADVTTLADVVGECSATVTVTPTATDNCAGAITGTTTDPLTYSAQGTYTIVWTYDDGNGNMSTQTQTVIVDDVTAPVADVASLTDVTAECTVTIATAPTATDNCSGAITGTTTDPLTYTGEGTYIVTWSYEDAEGNISTQSQNVIIDDVTAPVPDVATLADVTEPCTVTSLVDPTATDNCGTVIVSNDATLPINATTVVTWTYDDGNGNTTTQTQNVIISDATAPTPDVAMLADVTGACEVTALTPPTATDNCSAVTVTSDAVLPITATTVVTWTYTDENGNVSTQTQNIVITDVTAPTASNLPAQNFECIGDVPTPDVTLVDDATDNCTAVPMVVWVSDVSDGNTCPEVITRTYEVSDNAGNTSVVTQVFTIEDVTAPTASNPLSINVQCIDDVPAPNASWVTDEADNCGAPVVAWVSDVSDGLSCPETISRTFSVTDDCGNSINVVQLIVVNDLNAPIADATSLPTETAYCDVTLTAPTATDNCSGVVTGTTSTVFPINTVGTTTVTWTFTDDCGNSSTQTQNVVIEEMETGTWIANDGLTIVSSNLETGVTYQWIDCGNGNQPIAGQTNHNFTPTTTGQYAVVTTIAGCSDTSDCVSAVAGIDEVLNAKLNVYPNPTNGAITIEFDGEVNTIEIIDLTGRIVFVSNNVNTEIEPGVEPGEYMVVIKTDAGTAVQKLVVL